MILFWGFRGALAPHLVGKYVNASSPNLLSPPNTSGFSDTCFCWCPKPVMCLENSMLGTSKQSKIPWCHASFELQKKQSLGNVPICHVSFQQPSNMTATKIQQVVGSNHCLLTNWWLDPPIWKMCESQIGSFPQVGLEIKNIWVATTQNTL